jgi:hypothetical protein
MLLYKSTAAISCLTPVTLRPLFSHWPTGKIPDDSFTILTPPLFNTLYSRGGSHATRPIAFSLGVYRFDWDGEVIHACVRNDNGAVCIVSAETVCTAEEHKLEWDMSSLQGPQGAQGAIGATGVAGAQGPAGVNDLGCTPNQIIKWDDAAGQWLCSGRNDIIYDLASAELYNRPRAAEPYR